MKCVIKVRRQTGKKVKMETFSALTHSEEGIARACGREMIDGEEGREGWEDKNSERERERDREGGRGQTSYSSCRQLTESLK